MKSKLSVTAQFAKCMRGKDAKLQEVAQSLRVFMKKTVPGVKETINPWGLPTFESNGPLGYMMVGKKHVTFGLLRGTSLDDPDELLEGVGKNLRHVKLRTMEDLKRSGLKRLVTGAARLNRKEPLTGMPRGEPKRRRGRK